MKKYISDEKNGLERHDTINSGGIYFLYDGYIARRSCKKNLHKN